MPVPDGPGLGVEIDWEFVEKHRKPGLCRKAAPVGHPIRPPDGTTSHRVGAASPRHYRCTAVIVGARHASHLPDILGLFSFELDEDDLAAIKRVTDAAEGPVGGVYALERIKGGKHAVIMRYNLSRD